MTGPTDNVAMNSRLALLFVKTAMLYLIIGSVLLFLSITSIVPLSHDPIFIMELYGFVVMMIFGLSYIFIPGLSHSHFANYRFIEAEFVLLNTGIVFLVIPLLQLIPIQIAKIIAPIAFFALLLGILIHVVNIIRMIPKKNVIIKTPEGKTAQI